MDKRIIKRLQSEDINTAPLLMLPLAKQDNKRYVRGARLYKAAKVIQYTRAIDKLRSALL